MTTSHAIGSARRSASLSRGWWKRRLESRRPGPTRGGDSVVIDVTSCGGALTLDLGPGGPPVLRGLADITPVVATVRLGRVPEVDVLRSPVRLVVRVVRLAVVGVSGEAA